MRIAVGQDALGRWAWIVFDDADKMVASGDDCKGADLAMEAALDHIESRQKAARPAGPTLRRIA